MVSDCSRLPSEKRKTTRPASLHWPIAAAPTAAIVISTFMSTERARSEYQAARAVSAPPVDHGRREQERRERRRQGLGGKAGRHRHAGDRGERGAGVAEQGPSAAGGGARDGRVVLVAGVVVAVVGRGPAWP